MSAEALFCAELIKLKRYIIIKSVQRAALNASLIFLCIRAVLLFIERSQLIILSDDVLRHGIPIGISLTAAVLLAVVRRKNLQNTLIDIDARLKLQDRLSTAYEYQRSGKKSVLFGFLMEDAARQLRQLEIKHIAPAKFSPVHLALIFLLVLNVALYASHFGGPKSKPAPAEQEQIEKTRTLLRNYTQSRIGGIQAKKMSPGHAYARQLEQLINRLDDPALNLDGLSASLNTLQNELQAEQARLADELRAKLDALKGEGLSVQPIGEPGDLSTNEIEKLKALLQGALGNQIPDSLNQNIETLQEFSSLEKLLSRIINDLKEDDSYPDEHALSQAHQTRRSQYANDGKETLEDIQTDEAHGKMSAGKQGRAETDGPRASDQSREDDLAESDDAGLHDEFAVSAGRAKSAQRKKRGDQIEKLTGPGVQDRLSSTQEKKYRLHIRSLSTIGQSTLQEEDMIQTYRHEIESILQKEDIPLNYRQYIKQYFILIGLETEARAYEND